jgi:hypothetical protein
MVTRWVAISLICSGSTFMPYLTGDACEVGDYTCAYTCAYAYAYDKFSACVYEETTLSTMEPVSAYTV